MKLYTYYRSQASFRVRIALNLKGIGREDSFLHLEKGDQFAAAYRQINPQMVVPTLIDGDVKLFQSLAILEYLEEKFPEPPLLPELTDEPTEVLPPLRLRDDRYNRYPLSPKVRVRVFSQLGNYPRHSIAVPDARLLVNDELVVSCVYVEPPEMHGLEDHDLFEFEFLTLEETRFLAAIALAVHPDKGMTYTYPLYGHVDVDCGTDDDALMEAARELAIRPPSRISWTRTQGGAPLPACGGPDYQWREGGVNVDRVRNVVCAAHLNDHLLMRGLGALLQADMCSQHLEIAGVAVLPLYVALEASFQLILRLLREQGVSNPTALDAGALVDAEVFNQRHGADNYFGDFYEDRIKTMHPSSRFGVFAVPPLASDDYFFLRHALVEVYHWLITKQRL